MFEALRKAIFPIIIIVLVFFLGMIILQWGLDLGRGSQGAQAIVAGSVNGEDITWTALSEVNRSLYRSEQQKDPEADISDARSKELELQAWNQLVMERLLTQEAEKRNIVVTDEDIYTYLKVSPPQFLLQAEVFQTNGSFDRNKYFSALADPNFTQMWAQLEPQLRAEMQKLKLQLLVTEAAHITSGEVEQAFLDANERVKIGAINIQKRRFDTLVTQPTAEEMQAYFDANRDNYRVGERVVLQIAKASKEPSDRDLEEAETLAKALSDSAKAGVDFAELAMVWSEDPGSGSKGGDLGWFAAGKMVAAFDSASFSMKEGEISEPIKTQFGWHILKHFGYRMDDPPPTATNKAKVKKAKVSHILIKTKASPETLMRATDCLDTLLVHAIETDFPSAATLLNQEIIVTEPLTQQTRSIEGLGYAPNILTWAFDNEVGAVSNVMETNNDFCVVFIEQKLPEGLAEFDAVQEQVEADMRSEAQLQFCRDTARVIYETVQAGTPLPKAAGRFGMTYEEIGPFTRTTRLSKLSADPKAIGAAFSLTELSKAEAPVDYSNGTVIMELLEKDSPDLITFEERREALSDSLLLAKKQQMYSNWFSTIYEESDIQSNVGRR